MVEYHVNDTYGMNFKRGESINSEPKDDGIVEPVGPYEAKWAPVSTLEHLQAIEAAYDGIGEVKVSYPGPAPLAVSPGSEKDTNTLGSTMDRKGA